MRPAIPYLTLHLIQTVRGYERYLDGLFMLSMVLALTIQVYHVSYQYVVSLLEDAVEQRHPDPVISIQAL